MIEFLGVKISIIHHTAVLSKDVQRAETNYGGYNKIKIVCTKSIDDMGAPVGITWMIQDFHNSSYRST